MCRSVFGKRSRKVFLFFGLSPAAFRFSLLPGCATGDGKNSTETGIHSFIAARLHSFLLPEIVSVTVLLLCMRVICFKVDDDGDDDNDGDK